ncbi:MAG: DUF433 domain-containing protein [Nitrospirae bacterium]|nr:DUF433 domain-containing protein [Nitrospirota bacterium]
MTLLERIEINPKVCNGKPVIKGTRIPKRQTSSEQRMSLMLLLTERSKDIAA